MIIVTGAAGFIGSALIWKLNKKNVNDIVAIDNLYQGEKWLNLRKRNIYDFVKKEDAENYLKNIKKDIEAIIHLGARTDTAEKDVDFLLKKNFEHSKLIWNICKKKNIPLLYASSAATYGDGSNGFLDNEKKINSLKPLNPYGWSKQLFDQWVMQQKEKINKWHGFKFFNVYGPQEYHKKQMASVIFHAFNQVEKEKKISLFKSYDKNYMDGEQKRDFIYVKDVVDILVDFLENKRKNGIYNVGTGKAYTFNELAKYTFSAMGKKQRIEYVEMPDEIKENYQYYTKAKINKLKNAGYTKKICTLEEGITDYVKNHLIKNDRYL